MACIETKADLKRYINSRKEKGVKQRKAKGKDTERFDRSDITPSMFINFFTKKNNDQKKRKKLFGDLQQIIKDGQYDVREIVPSFWRKIKGLKEMDIDNMTIFHDENGKDSEMTALNAIQAGVAFHHIMGSVKTEMDLMDKHNLSEEERNLITPIGELVPGISGLGGFAAIGRAIAMSEGVVLTPKKTTRNRRQAQFDVESAYAEVGLKAVQLLEKRGFVELEHAASNDSTGRVINHDYKDVKGESYSRAKTINGAVIRIKMDKLLNGKSFDQLTEREKKIIPKYITGTASYAERIQIEDSYKKLGANMKGATFMNRLLTPSNTIAPFTSKVKNDHSNHDVNTHKGTKDVLDQKEAGSTRIPPDLEEMFDFIYDKMASGEGKTFEEVAKQLGINEYKDMMGFAEEFDSTAATRASDRGVSLSRTTPIAEFFDNYAAVRNLPFHLREEIKRNGRGHYMTTMLNPQTDKFFSRYVMQIPEYSIPAYKDGEMSSTFEHLLSGIADQAGLSVDEVLNAGKNSDLDELLSVYEAHRNGGPESTFTMISRGFRVQDGGLGGSVWQKYDTVKAIYSVREAIANGKNGNATFKGTFMPKPDGTASGAIIISMQMAGKNVDNASLYDALGLNTKKDGTIDDAYGVAEKAFNDFYALSKHENTKSPMQKAFDYMLTDQNGSGPVFSSMRELAKEASMPVMYAQGRESSISTVAKNLTDAIYKDLVQNKDQYEQVKQVMNWIKISDKRLHRMLDYELKQQSGSNNRNLGTLMVSDNFSQPVYSAINTYMKQNVTNQMYELINEKFVEDYMSEYNKVTDDLFDEMKDVYDIRKQRITMVPPEYLFNAVREDMGGEFDITKFDPKKYLSNDFLAGLKKNAKGDTIARGVPLMKLFETVNHPELNSTVARWEFPHAINAKVNMIHSIDFAILNEAFRRTFAEASSGTKNQALADLDLVANGTISVHDAISAHPTFSEAYQEHYRQAATDINAVYDIHRMLAFELVNMKGYEADSDARANVEKSTMEGVDKKVTELKNMDSSGKKVFGFKPLEGVTANLGTPVFPAKHRAKGKKTATQNQQQQEQEQEVAYKINKPAAKRGYDAIMKLKESGDTVVLYDTETIGDAKEGKGAHSLPWQIHAVKIENGKKIPMTFYFEATNEEVDPAVAKFNGYENDIEGFKNMILENFEKQGYDSNEEAYKAFSEFVGKAPKIAFRANFDGGVVTKANNKWGSDVKSKNLDIAAAIAHEERTLMGQMSGGDAQWQVYNRMVLDSDSTNKDFIQDKDDSRLHDAEFDTKLMEGIWDVLGTKHTDNSRSFITGANMALENDMDESQFNAKEKEKFGNKKKDYKFLKEGMQESAESAKYIQDDSRTEKEKDDFINKNAAKINSAFPRWAKASKIIGDFVLDMKNNKNYNSQVFGISGTFSYDPTTHTIGLMDFNNWTDKMAIYAVEHEIAHYKSEAWMAKNDKHSLVKTINHAVKNIGEYREQLLAATDNEFAKERLKYFMDQEDAMSLRAELVAVLGSEKSTRDAFLKSMKDINSKNNEKLNFASKFVKAARLIYERAQKVITGDKVIDPDKLLSAIDEILVLGHQYNMKDIKDTRANAHKSGLNYLKATVDVDMSKERPINIPGSKLLGFAKNNNTTNQNGKAKSKLNEALKYNKQADSSYVSEDPLSIMMRDSNSYIADLLWERLGPQAEPLAKEGAKAVDKYLTENSDTYVQFRNKALDIWDHKEMQGIKTYLHPNSLKQRDAFQKISSLFLSANQAHGKRTTTEVRDMENLMTGMTEDEKAKLNDVFAIAPAFMLVKHDGIMNSLARNATTIDREIRRLERSTIAADKKIAKDLANLYMDGMPTGRKYNSKLSGLPTGRVARVEQLTALYSLRKVDGSEKAIQNVFNNYNELYYDLTDKIRATEETTEKLYNETNDVKNFRGNMMMDYFDDNVEFKAASRKEMLDKAFDIDSGWEVAIPAKDNGGYAIMYRKGAMSQHQEGFGTNIGYNNTDVYMPKEFKPNGNMKHIVEFGSGDKKHYKAVIPMTVKKKIGLIQNPAHTIIRTYAHVQKIQDSQAIREEIVSNSGIRYTVKSNKDRDMKEIERMATERGEDEPMFIKLGHEASYTELPAAVKQRFSIIKPKMSNVGNFQNEVHLVRNDVSPWMVGYERAMPFKNIPMLEPVFNTILQAISLLKIHMIIVNPAKVMLDTVSTTTLLVSYGVSPTTVAKGWKRNMPLMSSMSALRGEQIKLTFKAHSGNKTAQKALEKVEEKLRNHPLMGAINAGVMQSLTTDIITRDYDTITGLQKNLENIVKKLTRDKDGVPNGFSDGLMKMASMGLNVEDLFTKMAEMGDNIDTLRPMAEEIAEMGKRIKRIKNDKDAEKYLLEFFASPSSTLTRLGSIATTYPDAMSRIIYRDHLISKTGKKESELTDKEISKINQEVSDFMPDYAFHPPMILDATGRWFITPFVSWSARIQRVLLVLAKQNPMSFLAPTIILEMMGFDVADTPYHVLGSNYITRDEFINNVFDDLFSLETILPMNAGNFDIVNL